MADGKIDLENESSGNKPLSFSDLPNKVLGEIVDKLDLVSRLRTRKVSRRLRTVVDEQKVHYQSIGVFTTKNRVDILFDANSASYVKNEDNFLEIALNDLAIALTKPTFQLEKLTLSFGINAGILNEKISQFFESLKPPIHIKTIRIPSDYNRKIDVLPILALLEPGTLETIDLGNVNLGLNANKLVEMDQWKKVKNFYIATPLPVDIREFLNFDSFFIEVDSISPGDVILLRDVLSESANFKFCSLVPVRLILATSMTEITRIIGATDDYDPFDSRFYHEPSYGSNEFLQFKISPDCLSIWRKL